MTQQNKEPVRPAYRVEFTEVSPGVWRYRMLYNDVAIGDGFRPSEKEVRAAGWEDLNIARQFGVGRHVSTN